MAGADLDQLGHFDLAARLGVREKAVEKQVARGMRLLTAAVLAGNDTVAAADLHDDPGLSESEFEHG